MQNGKEHEKKADQPMTREEMILYMHRSLGTAKRQIASGKRIHPLAIILHNNIATTLPIYTDNDEIKEFCRTILDCFAKKVKARAVLTMYEDEASCKDTSGNPHEIHMVVTADSPCCHFRITTTLRKQENNTITSSPANLTERNDNIFTDIIWPGKCSMFN